MLSKELNVSALKDTLEGADLSIKLHSLIVLYIMQNNDRLEKYPDYAESITFDDYNRMSIQPISEDAMRIIRNTGDMAKEKNQLFFGNQIPNGLLWVDTIEHTLLWSAASRKVKANSTLEGWEGIIHWPEILFHYKNKELYAFAINGKNLHVLSIPHYENKNGWICLGEYKESLDVTELIKNLEYSFYNNGFSSWSHSDAGEIEQKEIKKLYFDDEKWNAKKFKKLPLWTETLSDYIKSII